MKSVKEIIEDLNSQDAHQSWWIHKEPEDVWDVEKQEKHDKKCTRKDCILRIYGTEATKNVEQIYASLGIQKEHISYWFVKGWSVRNQRKHKEECKDEHCILITHRKKITMKQALENGKKHNSS